MIGNDIVDFAQAAKESNWRRQGWLDKIFVPEEQGLIQNAINPDRLVWLLWSMKEATYKAHQRVQQHPPRFNPKSFFCSVIAQENINNLDQVERKGNVIIGGSIYQTKSTITKDFVHTTATKDGFFTKAKSIVITNPKTEQVFKKAQSYLPQTTSNHYKLQKDTLGIPQIFDGETQTPFLISISHHGRFGSGFLKI